MPRAEVGSGGEFCGFSDREEKNPRPMRKGKGCAEWITFFDGYKEKRFGRFILIFSVN